MTNDSFISNNSNVVNMTIMIINITTMQTSWTLIVNSQSPYLDKHEVYIRNTVDNSGRY